MAVSRHFGRILLMQSVFEWEFHYKVKTLKSYLERNMKDCNFNGKDVDFVIQLFEEVEKNLEGIKKIIQKYAPEWPVDKISPVDRAILYIGVCEIMFIKREDVPPVVAINESIEMAKQYGGDNSSKFINGVLSNMYEAENIESKSKS